MIKIMLIHTILGKITLVDWTNDENLQISESFAEMIFHHGFVHCDPHAANMMLQVKPGMLF